MKTLFFLALLFSCPAFADEAADDQPCREDLKKFCGDVKPGGGAVIQCMREHHAQLSPACQEKIGAAKERRAKRLENRKKQNETR